ncbi:endo-1,4-beta-xylanase [Halalkalibacter sp. APA_J-10(15)]|uniref:endo-1,4-beta-xylanase n=1 Tax=Halalkalibacter sp. APA_J-10(15) TaxID=2933805 RepID=UPI001FF29A00|nr:endo-1,4-beta-xylanase [Halalkalibacter sp. APA_J-10(15)]MCK0470990.1 endo-1,4-beta-xylanase [Halalkalibacter sp. APA_J-10(15)]
MVQNSKVTESKRLHEVFGDYFSIGAAVNSKTIHTQRDLLSYHYNSITAENEMKFESLHPCEHHYTFEHADRLISFAKEHEMEVRGHTLVWHNQTSKWVFEQQDGNLVDRQTLLKRMQSHIETVMKRYKGQIYAWDVVNEVVSDKNEEMLRPSKWLDIVGEDFISKAFEYAHSADPNALLFYNDYNEFVPKKREKIYSMVKSLKENGTPIHGIGLQAHWNLEYPTQDLIRQGLERYASLGLQLHITELDVSVFNHDDRRTDLVEPTEALMEMQAERYEMFFNIFKEYSDVISSVTFWGAADDYTWLNDFPVRGRRNWPFPFDSNHQPKKSYWKLLDVARS